MSRSFAQTCPKLRVGLAAGSSSLKLQISVLDLWMCMQFRLMLLTKVSKIQRFESLDQLVD